MAQRSLGKYRIIAEVGQGGMAEVYLAVTSQNSAFSKLLVIKRMKDHLVNDIEFMTMFVDEARIAARLNHPNLVQTIEVGEAQGQHFLTMEYLDGQPLHRLLHRARAEFPPNYYLSILIEVLEGIHYAHELRDFDGTPLNIVHRDVTPHNIFIVYEGQVKVVDFGIAKAAGRSSETRHGVIKGKIAYMAPEQALGRVVDRRADLFAVGVMAFEAVTRQRMWKGLKEDDIIRALIAGTIPGPSDLDPNVDAELDRIIRKALAYAPDDRYQTAADLQADLTAYLEEHGRRPTPRELGGFVAKLFDDKRKLTSRIIEKQLAELRRESRVSIARMPDASESPASSETSPVAAELGTSPPLSGGASEPLPPWPRFGSNAPDGEAAETMVLEQPERRKLLFGALAALLVLVITALVTIVVLRPTHGDAAKKNITLTLRATPLETRFSIDGGPFVENPFIGEFARDHKEHTVRVVAPGYPPKQETVVFDDDVSMRFTLAAAAKP